MYRIYILFKNYYKTPKVRNIHMYRVRSNGKHGN